MSVTRMRVWRNFLIFIVPFSYSQAVSYQPSAFGPIPPNILVLIALTADCCISSGPRWPGRFPQQNLRAAGNEKIRHGADFLVPLFLVEIPGSRIEVGHAGKEVLGSRKDQRLDVPEQLRADPSASCPGCHAKQFQIVAKEELLTDDRNGRDVPFYFCDKTLSARRDWTKYAFPVLLRIAQRFPGVGVA